MTVDVWLLDSKSVRPPRQVRANLVEDKRGHWAVSLDGKTRKLIGATAFLTEKSATQRWQGNLDRIRKSRYIARFQPHIWQSADDLCTVNVYKGRR